MDANRKDGQLLYRRISVSYSAYGEKKDYSARSVITIHSGDHTTETVIELSRSFEALGEAEQEIINAAKKWIDNYLVN